MSRRPSADHTMIHRCHSNDPYRIDIHVSSILDRDLILMHVTSHKYVNDQLSAHPGRCLLRTPWQQLVTVNYANSKGSHLNHSCFRKLRSTSLRIIVISRYNMKVGSQGAEVVKIGRRNVARADDMLHLIWDQHALKWSRYLGRSTGDMKVAQNEDKLTEIGCHGARCVLCVLPFRLPSIER